MKSKPILEGLRILLSLCLVGLKTTDASKQLDDMINMMDSFEGRQCSIDLGYYDIIDPYTGKKVPVTIMYHIAGNYIITFHRSLKLLFQSIEDSNIVLFQKGRCFELSSVLTSSLDNPAFL